tara:strand:+ start:6589 stop:6720 length:132 start_codon:yes stop_codon:yes gene_type:complete
MKKIPLLFKSLLMLISAPIEISKGQRRRAILQAKKVFKSANLF